MKKSLNYFLIKKNEKLIYNTKNIIIKKMIGVFISKIEPLSIYFTKKNKENIIYDKFNLKKNINNLNLKNINWEKCSVGNSITGKNYIDENIRTGYYSNDKIVVKNYDKLNFLNNIFNNDIFSSITYCISTLNDEDRYWKILKYEKNGFFQRHKDGICNENHFATAIIIPPLSLNKYEGGELILYGENEELVIKADENDWKLVVFGLEIEHELRPIILGERIVFVSKFEYNIEMKYIMNSLIYNDIIELKSDNKSLLNEKKIINSKIIKLQNEINKYKNIIQNYENNNYILQELVDEIIKKLKCNDNNIFIVALKDYYTKPIPTEFNIKDIKVYNTIINYFKYQNIQIRVMNILCQINKGDEDIFIENKLSNSFNKKWQGKDIELYVCEEYESNNKDDEYIKFENHEIICPVKYYDKEYVGELKKEVSQYNDETYDKVFILHTTFLYCSLNNIFYEKNNS
jgi:predicted 2-oxoglutarate/Fe(II)-dependent dioxygenase YbiX